MLEIASQIILCLLLAALLGFIIGYLFGKGTCASENCKDETKDHEIEDHETKDNVIKKHESESDTKITTKKRLSTQNSVSQVSTPTTLEQDTTNTQVDSKTDGNIVPNLLKEARNGKKDKLTRIKGISLKIDETLNNMGIYHFDQIASWTEENITWVDENIAFPGRVKRENWVAQAKALAEEIETDFSKRVDAGEVSSSKKA